MKIATTTGDFREYASLADIPALLTFLADSGFRYADLNLDCAFYEGSPLCSNNWEQWTYEIGNTAARLGIGLVQAHSSDTAYEYGERRDYLTSIIEREIAICGKLGVGQMVVHAVYTHQGERDDFMVKNTELYKSLMPAAEKENVGICTENTCLGNCPHYYLFTAEDLNELCAKVDHPLFGVCWDVGHGHWHHVDPYETIMALGKNLKALHVHDNFGDYDRHIQPYAGNFCFDALLKGLQDSGYAGCFTLEAFCTPVASGFCNCSRKPFVKEGVVYDKALMPPVSFKIRSERLMLDTVRWMLDAYGLADEADTY